MTEAYTRQTLHDYALDHIYAVAESMGYRIVEINLAREHRTGPDIYVVNPANGKGVMHACTVRANFLFYFLFPYE